VTKPTNNLALANNLAWASAGLVALVLAGCSSGSDLLKAPANLASATIDKIANTPLPSLPSLPNADPEPVGSPTEIYTRIARGATVCWFGTHGTLKATHIFDAEAAPPSQGGRAGIVIHEKDTAMPNPRGNRAFRIDILPAGSNAKLEIENIRFPIETGQKMTADVRRWARGDLACASVPQTKGWDSENQAPEATPASKPAGRRT